MDVAQQRQDLLLIAAVLLSPCQHRSLIVVAKLLQPPLLIVAVLPLLPLAVVAGMVADCWAN